MWKSPTPSKNKLILKKHLWLTEIITGKYKKN